MTRFARAKGSKASNERVPEDATSWGEMKQQLLEKNRHSEDTVKKHEAHKQREKNYKEFLQKVEEEQSRTSIWADFSADNLTKVKKGQKKAEQLVPQEVDQTESNYKKKASKRRMDQNEDKSSKKLKLLLSVNDLQQTKIKTAKQKKDISTENAKKTLKLPKKKKKKTISESNQVLKTENENNGTEIPTKFKKNPKKKLLVEKKGNENKELQSPEVDTSKESTLKTKKLQKKSLAVSKKLASAKPAQKRKTLLKQKLKNTQGTSVKKPKESLTEEELQKIAKKKEKRERQLEKKKTFTTTTEASKKPKGKNPVERRKKKQASMIINGKEVPIAYIDGFPIKKEDAERIRELRTQMISKGLPRSEIKIALKLERRKAEKVFAREKKKVCFNCRKSGHNLSECPDLGKQLAESSGTGICFKCGSTEHTHFECKVVRGQEFKFASCFICNEQGHIARQCPDNARGMYPKGGACRVCGDVTHLKKDCPKFQAQQEQLMQNVQAETMDEGENPDNLEKSGDNVIKNNGQKRINKIVKF